MPQLPRHYRYYSVLLILLCFPVLLRAQRFEAVTDYSHVGLHDTIELKISYYGSPDSVKNFKADLAPLRIIQGPNQSSNTFTINKGGQVQTTHRLDIVYYVSADTLGTFTIQGGRLFTKKEGRELKTAPLTIEVSPRPFRKTGRNFSLAWEQSTYPFDAFRDDPFDVPQLAGAKVRAVQTPFVLITGWVHQPESLPADSSLSILTEVDKYLQSRPDILMVDHKLDMELPRLYYSLNDTTGIRAHLSGLYSKGGAEAQAGIVFTDPAKWNIGMEQQYFVNPHDIWRVLYVLLKDAAVAGFKPEEERALEIRCGFRNAQQMDQFIKKVAQMGYKTRNTRRKAGTQKESYNNYTTDILQSSLMKDTALYAAVIKLSEEAGKPEYNGRVTRISIPNAKK